MSHCKIKTRVVVLLAAALLTAPLTSSNGHAEGTPSAANAAIGSKVTGKAKTVVGKSKTIAVEVGNELKVFKFNGDTKFINTASYKEIQPGEALVVEFKTVNSENIATSIAKIVAELPAGTTLIKTEELQALVQKGAEAGNYLLIDSRPAGRYHQAHIPTAVSLPYPEMDKLDKESKVSPQLPKDHNKLLIFYCSGITCHMSPAAAKLAVKQGYTNVKVYSGGDPAWKKAELGFASSVKFVKDENILLLDLRAADKFSAGHIPRALSLPASNLDSYKEANFPAYKGSYIVFYSDNQGDVDKALELMRDYDFSKASYFPGGLATWQKQGNPVESGSRPAPAKLTYTRVLAPNEISIAEFTTSLNKSGIVIIDARTAAEFAGGKLPGAINIPSEEMEKRFAEVPKDKPVYTYCGTGSRAEMAYDILKSKGYANVKMLKATITFEGNTYKITE